MRRHQCSRPDTVPAVGLRREKTGIETLLECTTHKANFTLSDGDGECETPSCVETQCPALQRGAPLLCMLG